MSGLGKEVGESTAVETRLTELTSLEERLTGALERAVEDSKELEGLGVMIWAWSPSILPVACQNEEKTEKGRTKSIAITTSSA